MKSQNRANLVIIAFGVIFALIMINSLYRGEVKKRDRAAEKEQKLKQGKKDKSKQAASGKKSSTGKKVVEKKTATPGPKSTFKPVDLKIPHIIASPDRVTARRFMVAELQKAVASGDYDKGAMLNSLFSQEAFERCYRVVKAWEKLRDPETGLIPRGTKEGFWIGKDNAADCYPFFLMTTHYLIPESEESWLKIMKMERDLSRDPLPQLIFFQPTTIVKSSTSSQIFSGAEYIKDGLIAVTERMGRGPWFDRMEEVMHAIISRSQIKAKNGRMLAAIDSEVNGDIAQVLPRLYWATGKKEYLDMCENIAETYLFEIMPNNNGLPAAFWDFEKGKSKDNYFKLRDHGNEIIPGLSEIYILEKQLKRPQAERYREPLRKLLTTLLTVGRAEDGMWYDWVKTDTLRTTTTRICDNWGYLCNAYLTFDIAEGTDTFTSEVLRTMHGATTRKSFQWEWDDMDGYADTLESMLYMLERRDFPEGAEWLDDEIEVMFLKQQESGLVEARYLDGNFVRTALLYANYKTQGTMVSPWRHDVCAGAQCPPGRKELHLYLNAQTPWQGSLKFDYARHSAVWNMTVSYPRLNSWPEWFVVDPAKQYVVTDLDSGKKSFYSGKILIDGMPLTLDGAKPVRLKVAEAGKTEPVKASPVKKKRSGGRS